MANSGQIMRLNFFSASHSSSLSQNRWTHNRLSKSKLLVIDPGNPNHSICKKRLWTVQWTVYILGSSWWQVQRTVHDAALTRGVYSITSLNSCSHPHFSGYVQTQCTGDESTILNAKSSEQTSCLPGPEGYGGTAVHLHHSPLRGWASVCMQINLLSRPFGWHKFMQMHFYLCLSIEVVCNMANTQKNVHFHSLWGCMPQKAAGFHRTSREIIWKSKIVFPEISTFNSKFRQKRPIPVRQHWCSWRLYTDLMRWKKWEKWVLLH